MKKTERKQLYERMYNELEYKHKKYYNNLDAVMYALRVYMPVETSLKKLPELKQCDSDMTWNEMRITLKSILKTL